MAISRSFSSVGPIFNLSAVWRTNAPNACAIQRRSGPDGLPSEAIHLQRTNFL
ncbi:MAG: hypothetical protein ACFB14_24285 [Leptolyngbyaceae cyanobacterium]